MEGLSKKGGQSIFLLMDIDYSVVIVGGVYKGLNDNEKKYNKNC